MAEQIDWIIAVEYKIEIVRCIDGEINGENVATDWLWQTAQQKFE